MQEALRRQYLSLLGVDVWVPRDAEEPVESSVAAGGGADAAVGAIAPPTGAGAEAPVGAIAPPAGAGAEAPAVESRQPVWEALLRRPDAPETPAAATPEPPAATQSPAAPVSTPIPEPAPPAATATPETVSCSLQALPDGLLLLAAHLPQAPGLSGPEHALLANIAQALAPSATLPAPAEFQWPPPGVRLPAAASGGTPDALVGLLAEHRRRQGLRDLLVLGEPLAQQVQPVATRLGLRLIAVPALSAMLADPALKRVCWDAAKPLRRG